MITNYRTDANRKQVNYIILISALLSLTVRKVYKSCTFHTTGIANMKISSMEYLLYLHLLIKFCTLLNTQSNCVNAIPFKK